MNKDIGTVVKACGASAFVFGVLALLLGLSWWSFIMAVAAGLCTGYLCCEFQGVRTAIPRAWKKTCTTYEVTARVLNKIKGYFKKPHPVMYPYLVLAILFSAWVFNFIMNLPTKDGVWGRLLAALFFIFIGLFILTAGFFSAVEKLLTKGAELRRVYWDATSESWNHYMWQYEEDDPFTKVEITYLNIYSVMFAGFVYYFWETTKATALFLFVNLPKFVGFLLWELFKLIHSKKRVLCGVDGCLGGLISVAFIAPHADSFLEYLAVLFFCVVFGVILGLVSWEVLSLRVLKLVPMVTVSSDGGVTPDDELL